jgi:hypothetical protein
MLFLSMNVLLMPACFHTSDAEIVSRAQSAYAVVKPRYATLFAIAERPQELERQARIVAQRRDMSFGDACWTTLIGESYLIHSKGTPLHRAVHFITQDRRDIEWHAYQLQRRALGTMPLYYKLEEAAADLRYLAQQLQAHTAYVEESQFIEQQRLQESQLSQSRQQTLILEELARKKRYKQNLPGCEPRSMCPPHQTIIVVK